MSIRGSSALECHSRIGWNHQSPTASTPPLVDVSQVQKGPPLHIILEYRGVTSQSETWARDSRATSLERDPMPIHR
jgi:hypothetical protein